MQHFEQVASHEKSKWSYTTSVKGMMRKFSRQIINILHYCSCQFPILERSHHLFIHHQTGAHHVAASRTSEWESRSIQIPSGSDS